MIRQSTISVFASDSATAARYRRNFPQSLDNAPFLLPTTNIEIRRSLDEWFEDNKIRPEIVAEIEDSALLKTFAEDGMGLVIAPTVVRETIEHQYRLQFVGELADVIEQFYAITTQRKARSEAVAAILGTQADPEPRAGDEAATMASGAGDS
jgi:LysR family transcriptional activator of nhaA